MRYADAQPVRLRPGTTSPANAHDRPFVMTGGRPRPRPSAGKREQNRHAGDTVAAPESRRPSREPPDRERVSAALLGGPVVEDFADEDPDEDDDGPDPYLGTVLGERYAIEEVIGEGGMGRVYLARHRLIDKPVAIK